MAAPRSGQGTREVLEGPGAVQGSEAGQGRVSGRKARGQIYVEPEPEVALKIALNRAVREQSITAAELARRIQVDHKEARRILDPKHRTKFGRMIEAFGHSAIRSG